MIIENHKLHIKDINYDKHITLAKSIAQKSAIKYGIKLDEREMIDIHDRLLSCSAKNISPDGRKIIRMLSLNDLADILTTNK